MAMTASDMKALSELAKVMSDASDVLFKAVDAGRISAVNAGLEGLVPSGALDALADTLKADTVISDEDLAALIERAKVDIDQHSRLDGLVQNVTSALGAISSTVLPMVAGVI